MRKSARDVKNLKGNKKCHKDQKKALCFELDPFILVYVDREINSLKQLDRKEKKNLEYVS